MTKTEWDRDPAAQKKTWIYLGAMGTMFILLFAPLPHWKHKPAKPFVPQQQTAQISGGK